jgi:hypothetical protein
LRVFGAVAQGGPTKRRPDFSETVFAYSHTL